MGPMRPLVFTLGLCLAGASFAQVSADDMAKAAEPGDRHKMLARMVGDWTVEVVYKIGTVEGKGTADCHAEMILGGRFLTRNYASEMGGQPFHVMQTIGFDTLRKEFFEWQVESNNTGRLETKGTWDEAEHAIVCTGPSFDPATFKPATLRTKTIFDSEDQFTIEWWMKSGDGAESKQVTLVHKRKK